MVDVPTVLIVDNKLSLATDLARDLKRALVQRAEFATSFVDVTAESDFANARARLRTSSPTLLITALHLEKYNGLHLVHVAAGGRTRCVVHTDSIDPATAREVQAAGAFYETRLRLLAALPGYLAAGLPTEDRRAPLRFDRRQIARGGRRATDVRSFA